MEATEDIPALPTPDALVCTFPQTLSVDLGTADLRGDRLEATLERLIEEAAGAEVLRLHHSGSAFDNGRLELAIRLAQSSGLGVELITTFNCASAELIKSLAEIDLDRVCVVFPGSLGRQEASPLVVELQPLRESLNLLRVNRQAIATNAALDFIFESTVENLGLLRHVLRLAHQVQVKDVTVHPLYAASLPLPATDAPGPETFDEILSHLLPQLRTEFPAIRIDASTCETYHDASISAQPRSLGGHLTGSEQVFSCLQSPWDSTYVLADGNVATCSFRKAAVLGNLAQDSLTAIWNGKRYRDFRAVFQAGTDPICSACPQRLPFVPVQIRSTVTPEDGNTVEFLAGWHWSEGKVIWSKRRSRILLSCRSEDNAASTKRFVQIEGHLPGTDEAKANTLSIWHRGRILHIEKNASASPRGFRVRLPFKEPSAWAQFLFVVSEIHSPRLSGSSDERDLGFALTSIAIEAAPERLLAWHRFLPLYTAIVVGRLLTPLLKRRPIGRRALPRWFPGVSIIVPERRTPQLLFETLRAALVAANELDEPFELIVVVNGATLDLYRTCQAAFPSVKWLHSPKPLGFDGAVQRGLLKAKFDWVYLLNSDVTLAQTALSEIVKWRADHVFAVASQIFFADDRKRREETGWTAFRQKDEQLIELMDVVPENGTTVRGHLYAGGGCSLFRTRLLRRWDSKSRPYHPGYWEDAEWGLRAWRGGYEVLFCPTSHAVHIHRATMARVFTPQQLDRIWRRNQLLFSLRNGFVTLPANQVIENIRRTYDRQTQGELIALRQAASLLKAFCMNALSSAGQIDITRLPAKFYLRPLAAANQQPVLLVVSPFAVYPPAHGGARRIAQLMEHLSRQFNIVLLSDEETLYRADDLAEVRGPFAIHLTGGRRDGPAPEDSRISRILSHSHRALGLELERLAATYQAELIQIEYIELAGLVFNRKAIGPWILDLHDVLLTVGEPDEADQYEEALIDRHDLVLACSPEDAALLKHKHVEVIPNGFSFRNQGYTPSANNQKILFLGPFRYKPNLEGILHFLRSVYPPLLEAVPEMTLDILGGDNSPGIASQYACFEQHGVTVHEHVNDVRPWLQNCAVTINPLTGVRGSCLKVLESVGVGRICVSTEEGARGFRQLTIESLIIVPGVEDFVEPLQRILQNGELRRQLEKPDDEVLKTLTWEGSARRLAEIYGERKPRASGR